MTFRYRRLLACAVTASALLSVGTAVPATSAPAPASEPALPNLPDDVLAEYRKHYSDVPVDVLYARLRLMPARKALQARFAKEHGKTFGGSWYDFRTGQWHLYATNPAATAAMAAEAGAAGIVPAARVVPYSIAALVARAKRIGEGRDPMSKVSTLAGVDLPGNRVTVSAAASRRTVHDPMVTYIDPVPEERRNRDHACTTRRDCGVPLRSGVVLWRNGARSNPYCSLGFVAGGLDGTKWALTAGHCFADAGTNMTQSWGNGTTAIGVPGKCWWVGSVSTKCVSTTNADVGRIRITNSTWLNGGFGWVFNPTSPSSPVEVDSALTDRWSQLEYGEVACLNGWHISHTGDYSDIGLPGKEAEYEHVSDDRCGVIKYLFSGNDYQMVVVEDVDSCGGDSGGGWTYYPGNGTRMAAGIHNGTGSDEPGYDPTEPPPACNQGMYARFTPLDEVNARLDSYSGTTIRVITR